MTSNHPGVEVSLCNPKAIPAMAVAEGRLVKNLQNRRFQFAELTLTPFNPLLFAPGAQWFLESGAKAARCFHVVPFDRVAIYN